MTIAYAVIIVTVWSAKVPGERISKDIKSQIRLRKRVSGIDVHGDDDYAAVVDDDDNDDKEEEEGEEEAEGGGL